MFDYKDIFTSSYISGIRDVALEEIHSDQLIRTQVLHIITKTVSDCFEGDELKVPDEIHTQIVEHIRSSFWEEEPVDYGKNVQNP